jgi:two-component system response regulator RegA
MTDDSSPRILVVDDEEVFRQRLARAFRDRGYVVSEASDVPDAIAALEAARLDRAVIDLRLPSGSGLELVRTMKTRHPAACIVVLTGYGSIATALDAIRLGATHYLMKPAGVDDIIAGFEGMHAGAAAHDAVPSLARVEWEHINRVLADAKGNVSEAARRLGMHRRSLQRKLAKLPNKH